METFYVTKVSNQLFCNIFNEKTYKLLYKLPLHKKIMPRYQKLLQYFLQGLLILGPVTITVYVLYIVFDKIDGILRPAINFPGLGFIIIIGFILLVGYLSSFFIMSRFLSIIDKLLEKTPGIKLFYSFIKDFFEAFAGNKKKFTNSVLANVENNDVWRVGFITQKYMSRFQLIEFVAVYIPMSYSVAGNVYIIPKDRIKPITNISAAQTMKFAMSGGVTEFIDAKTIE